MASPRRSSRPSKRPRIVVLGGGFAGLAAAQTLRADRFDVTLVDQRRAFEWLPNIHELLSGVKRPEDLRLPLDELVRRAGHRFVRDAVVAIDPEARAIIPRRRKLPLPYDALIVACGGVDATRGVAGVREHAHGFKSVEECDRIGRRLARLGKRRRPAEVVIVGGGLEGVEALGEILRRPDAANLHVTLVEAGPRLLAEAPASLDRHVRALCADDAVVFETNAPVARIEADAVVLADGRTRPTDLTIWTGGPAPPDLLAASRLAPADAWAAVDRTLQSKDHPEIFVAGDAAELPTPLARQGYHALDMGRCAAANAMRQRDDRPLRAFRPSEKPMLIAFGDRSTFLVAGKRVLAGLPLASAKEAVFEVVLAQLDERSLPERLAGAAARADRATRRLLVPALTRPSAWPRFLKLASL